jgi:hypothetical protein
MLHKIFSSIFITLLTVGVAYTQELEDTRFFGDGFVVNQTLSGLPLHWADGEMAYHISGSVPNNFRSAVQDGFDAWHSHPEISNIIQSEYKGLTSSTQWGGPADGFNNVVYIDRNWTARTGAGSETVALTRIRYNAFTGRITDADIALNADNHRFSSNSSPPPNRYDIHNTIAHEVGHVWGLSDLFPPGHPGHNVSMGDDATNQLQTMYGVFPLRETLKRDINSGDVAGIMHIYDNLPVLNLDIVLVFDGSDNYVVKHNALTQSKNSGVELVDKLRIGDRIGVAQFPDMVVNDLKKIESNSDRVDVQTAIAGIATGGNVTVGSGLLKGEELLTSANSDNTLQAIILFSAGEEESPPWAIDIIENFPVPVYTIGFENSPGQTTLNMISDATGGEFFLVEDFTHIPDVVNLIWTHLANQLTIFADGGMTDNLIGNPDWQDGITVDDDVEILEPGIIWLGSDLDLCLISPRGEEICPEDGLFDYIKGPTYAFYNIKNPEKGKWGLKIVVNEAENQQFFGYMRAEARDFIMTAELDKQRYIIGDEIKILVHLVGGGHPLGFGHGRFGDPITDATVQANIDFPDGSAALVTLIHQANGLYTASVSTNELPGTYKFKVTASRGEEFIRERRLSTYVATSEDEFVVQTAFTILSHIINYIENLDPDNFRPAGEGRRGAFLNKFEVVSNHMHAEEYEKAIQKLEEDILPKVDGDWVVDTDDEPASTHLVTQVSRLIDLLSDIIHMQTAMANFSEGQFIDQENVPDRFSIFQNYPNPFNPVTTIRYQLPEDVHVTLSVYNLLGQRVRTIVDDLQSAGYYTVQWNGTNHSGLTLSSGMYFYRIQAGRYSEVRTMLFMK